MTSFRTLLALFALAAPVAQAQTPEIETSFPLQQVLVGESALLNIQIPGEETTGALTTSEDTPLSFESLGADYINRQVFCANIGVTSEQIGTFKVPSFNIPLPSGTAVSEEASVEVFSLDNIRWQTFEAENKTYRIGSVLLYPTGKIYEGQSVPLTAKILIPSDLPVRNTGFAEVEKENIGAWRMEPPRPPNYDQRVEPRPPNALRTRETIIDGRLYQIINYVTFAAPLKDGPVTVGPGKIQGLQVLISSVQQRPGFFSNMSRSFNIELELPAASFTATALPTGAPASFQGAIGQFSLESSIDATTELKAGDPVMVKLEVAGQGNIDTLVAPQLDAPESNWKIYPPSRNEQEGDRRTNRGSAVFSQILRPMVPIKEIPPFVFTFFNPSSAQYETLRTEAIPLNLAPLSASGSGSVEAGLVPIAEMTDILGLIEPQPFHARRRLQIGSYWQIIPALATLFLVAAIAKRELPRLNRKDPAANELQQDLTHLEKETESLAFLRQAAHLAESKGLPHDDFVTELVNERDAICFQPEATESGLTNERRKSILKGLKERLHSLILLGALLLVAQPTPAEASQKQAQKAWDAGQYQEALNAYELMAKDSETPDLFYNMGSCYYRLNQPGRAALFYHRALDLNPEHPEARQNLAFLERKLGAIPIPLSSLPRWTEKLPLSLVRTLLFVSLWALAILLLVRFAFPTSRNLKVSNIGSVVATFIAILLAILAFFHPGEAEAPFQPDSVVTSSETTELRTEPSLGGSAILTANPSTTCKVLTERNGWSYVELPTRTRGWIQSSALEQI